MKLRYNDKVHGYWLDGQRCKGVSTIAKSTDDTTRLDNWSKRMVLIGAATSRPLVEAAAAHFDDKSKLDELAEEAMRLAKAHHAAMSGTAVHRVLERADTGEPILPTPDANAVILSWNRLLDAAGFEVVPEYVERIVVYPDHRIAGRFDRILRRKDDGRLFLGDVKTGPNAVTYPHSTAIQLTIYANAPLMAAAKPCKVDGDAEEYDEFEPMPELDPDVAYVAHVTGPESIELVPFNIAAAFDAVTRIVFPMLLEWRPRRDLVGEPIRAQVDTPDEGDPFDGVNGEARAAPQIETPGDGLPAALREHLTERCRQLSELGHRDVLLAHWPASAPAVAKMTDEQLAALDVIVTAIEREVEAPFIPGPARPEQWTLDAATAAIQAAFPGAEVVGGDAADREAAGDALPVTAGTGDVGATSPPIDDGAVVDDDTVADIERRRLLLAAAPRGWVGDRVKEMKDAGRPLSLKLNPTERRAEIARGLIEWAGFIDKDGDEIPRAAVSYVTGCATATTNRLGGYIAEFTLEQARAFRALAKQLTDGDVTLDYSAGVCRIVPAAPAA